ncbi:efflux RND transporter permease subunit [Zavarzinia sp. CC-PAN008]|uniref:efflux RND transporter permease subunit n=1 Tax=Zavarzinia sp. CC-PAN008 TaxID=3243332 RepID=UPI003F74A206
MDAHSGPGDLVPDPFHSGSGGRPPEPPRSNGQEHYREGRFNLSALALRHRSLVLFLMIACAIAGFFSFGSLGRSEDPDFTIKIVVIRAFWPGATAREVELQVTDRIERAVQEVGYFDHTRSYARPGETTLFVTLKDSMPREAVQQAFYQVRKRVGDIRHTMPAGVIGPFFNDEFGDTFASVYAFTADGFSHAELRETIEWVRQEVLGVPDVQKVELVGVQPEKVFVEFESRRLALLGISPQAIFDTLARQNTVTPAGVFETPQDRVFLRVSGSFGTVDSIRNLVVAANGRSFRLGDIADVKRAYADPPTFLMRYQGEPAIGLAVSMAKGANVLRLGEALAAKMETIRGQLPHGIDFTQISDQPTIVKDSIDLFMTSLIEAVVIVLAVSFLSLGWRAGTVVALSIPLVLAMVMTGMEILGINLHRISLGAMIIALGLLVDDAIIAVEMMVVKLEQGWDRMKAASFAYTSTAFPMLTGTLLTAVGFLPVAFAQSSTGEFAGSIFWVVALALVLSWIVAVVFTPFIGSRFLKPHAGAGHGHAVYDGRFYRAFRGLVEFCLRWRFVTIGLTVAAFVVSLGAFGMVQQQFFPSASRAELIVDMRLAEGSSIAATLEETKRLEAALKGDEDIARYVTYVGGGTPRFYLPLIPEYPQSQFAQAVIWTKGLEERERVRTRLLALFENDFVNLRGRVSRLENGPPVGFPVQFRVMGPDPETLRDFAHQVRDVMRANPDTIDPQLDWEEKSRRVHVVVDEEKARVLGVDSTAVSQTLNSLMSGTTITQYREGDELIDVVARAAANERLDLEGLALVTIPTASGRAVPLSQVTRIDYDFENGVLWRRNRTTMITVRSDIRDGVQAPDVTMAVNGALDAVRARMPDGYRIEIGGALEESAKGQQSIAAVVPLMLLLMLLILMLQLESMSRMVMVLLTAPLALIGVTWALLLFNAPFGFVAMLGVIALAGLIMRNSVILVDQIDKDIAAGHTRHEAIVGATVRRFRPIMLTAAAAILAMIPLTRQVFWGPMAIAMMGGLSIGTVLTLLFLPALYSAWFRVRRDEPPLHPHGDSATAPPVAQDPRPVPAE